MHISWIMIEERFRGDFGGFKGSVRLGFSGHGESLGVVVVESTSTASYV